MFRSSGEISNIYAHIYGGGGSTSFYLILPHPNFAFFGCPNEVKWGKFRQNFYRSWFSFLNNFADYQVSLLKSDILSYLPVI